MRKAIIFLVLLSFVVGIAQSQTLPKLKMLTSLGEIVVEIDTVHAPLTASNFMKHVEAGTYKNAVFYRVVRMDNQPGNDVKIEVIQGGMFIEPRFENIEPIAHESTQQTGLQHLDGTISMARSEPGTASTEFFICIGDQPELDFGGKRNPDGQGFAAFGQVVEGMDVVRMIQQKEDKSQTLLQPVKVVSIQILR